MGHELPTEVGASASHLRGGRQQFPHVDPNITSNSDIIISAAFLRAGEIQDHKATWVEMQIRRWDSYASIFWSLILNTRVQQYHYVQQPQVEAAGVLSVNFQTSGSHHR